MKKKIIILALILVSGISIVRSQPVTGLIPADMSSYKSNLAETTLFRDGPNLVISVNAITDILPGDSAQIIIRIKFTENTRKEFEQFAGVVSLGKLGLKMVDENTGKSYTLTESKAGVFGIATHEIGHMYRFVLNGKVIGTGYKPK